MKKMFILLLNFCICLSLITCPVKAQEILNPIESFEIIGLEDREITTGDTLTFVAKSNLDVEFFIVSLGGYSNFFKLYKTENPNEYAGSLIVPREYKWSSPTQEVLVITVSACIDGSYKSWYYSHDYSKLVASSPQYRYENVQKIDEDYSFVVLDYEEDVEGPTLVDYEVKKIGSTVHYSVKGSDALSGYAGATLHFYDQMSQTEMVIFTLMQDVKLSSFDLYDYYKTYPYGTYELTKIELWDKLWNTTKVTEFSERTVIELKKEDNKLESLNLSTIDKSKISLTEELVVRPNTYFASKPDVYYDDGTELIKLGTVNIDAQKYASKPEGTYEENVYVDVQVNQTYVKKLQITVPIVVSNPTRELIIPEYIDICLDYEKYKNTDLSDQQNPYRTFIVDVIKPYMMYKDLSTNEIGTFSIDEASRTITLDGVYTTPYFRMQVAFFAYSPIYLDPLYPQGNSLLYNLRLYLVDKDGNLVDNQGRVLVPYAHRKELQLTSEDGKISVYSLEGSLPENTTLSYEKVTNLNNLFSKLYEAYAIHLNERIGVHPVDEVEIAIATTNKDIKVYNVDENNQKELLESRIEGNKVIVGVKNPNIIVIEKTSDILVGDVNDDGKINGLDSIILNRYNAGWELEINLDAADINKDGKVNGLDSILLNRYNAGWPDVL